MQPYWHFETWEMVAEMDSSSVTAQELEQIYLKYMQV